MCDGNATAVSFCVRPVEIDADGLRTEVEEATGRSVGGRGVRGRLEGVGPGEMDVEREREADWDVVDAVRDLDGRGASVLFSSACIIQPFVFVGRPPSWSPSLFNFKAG